jgi:chromosome segregation ATPase
MPETTDLEHLLQEAENDCDTARARVEAAEREVRAARLRLAEAEAELASSDARRESLVASLKELEVEADEGPRGVADMARTDAIVEVLRAADRPLSIADIRAQLTEHGRDGSYQVVASTLNYLASAGRITKPSRGRYASS